MKNASDVVLVRQKQGRSDKVLCAGLIVQDSATLHKLMPYISKAGSSPAASAPDNGSNGSSSSGHSNGSNGNGVQSSFQQVEC